MNKVKSFFKKIYYQCLKIIETYVLGTKFQEWLWKRRKRKWVEEYLKLDLNLPRQLLLETISKYKPFNMILEIGCASGPNLILLAKTFSNVKILGLDINKKAIEVGKEFFQKERISNVELLIGKADELNQFRDKTFDIVFTFSTLMYIGPDKIKKIAAEMKRIAKKAIILVEYHSEKESDLGNYNMGNWVRNYKKLFQPSDSEIKITKIPPEIWGGDWAKYGNIIEVSI